MDRWAKVPKWKHITLIKVPPSSHIVVAIYFHDSMQNISAAVLKSALKASQNQMEKARNKIYSDLRKSSHSPFKSSVILASEKKKSEKILIFFVEQILLEEEKYNQGRP